MADPGQYPQFDPISGLPKKKQQPYTQAQVDLSLAQNPSSTFGPSPSVNYGGLPGRFNPVTVPGFVPDYASLIKGDPIFGQQQADLSAQGISDASSRGAAVQRALVQFGEVPEFDALSGLNQGFLNADVNDTTRQLAARNTEAGFSVKARSAKQFKDNVRAIKNALAARGALQSGEAGHQLKEAQGSYDEARYDQNQQLVDYISGAYQGFAAAERARQAQLAQGAESAFERQSRLHPVVGSRTIEWGQPDYPNEPVGPINVGPSTAPITGGANTRPGGYVNNVVKQPSARDLEAMFRRLGN